MLWIARQDALADRGDQRPAAVLDRHATREPLRGRQRDAADRLLVALRNPAAVAAQVVANDTSDDLSGRGRE